MVVLVPPNPSSEHGRLRPQPRWVDDPWGCFQLSYFEARKLKNDKNGLFKDEQKSLLVVVGDIWPGAQQHLDLQDARACVFGR